MAQATKMLRMRTLYTWWGVGIVRPDTAQAIQMLRMRTLYLVVSGNSEAGHGPGHPDAAHAHTTPGGEWEW
jgi:hypothetical protein